MTPKKSMEKKEILPLSKAQLVFCEKYAHCQDLAQAAVEAGAAPEMGKEWYQSRKIRTEIKRIQNLVEKEKARIEARRNIVKLEKLDEHLMKLVEADYEKEPRLAPTKLSAVELGYKRAGILMDGNFIPEQGGGAATNPGARIYRSLETNTLITHEIITHKSSTREIVAPAPQQAFKGQVIEGNRLSSTSEVSDPNPAELPSETVP